MSGEDRADLKKDDEIKQLKEEVENLKRKIILIEKKIEEDEEDKPRRNSNPFTNRMLYGIDIPDKSKKGKLY